MDETLYKDIGKEGGAQIVLGFVLTKQLLNIADAAKAGLQDQDNREKWKATIFTLEDLLTGEWINLPEDHEFRQTQKQCHDNKITTPYEEIQKGRRLMQACLKLSKHLLPKTKRLIKTREEIPKEADILED